MVRPSFSSLSLKVRHKFSGQRTSKQQIDAKTVRHETVRQTDTETSNLHPNNKPTPNQQASSTLLDQTITMDEVTKTQHPSGLLHQVAQGLNFRHPEMSVTVPRDTTWKTVLRAIDSALDEVDGPIMILDKLSESQRQRRQQIFRQIALQTVKDWSSPANAPPGLPIRTQYDTKSLPFPKPASEETRKRLKEHAKSDHHFYDPYAFTLHAKVTEGTLPIVKAQVTLKGIDDIDADKTESLQQVDMIWDTGTHQTIITKELLSESFRQYLESSQHDDYRIDNGLRVQMEAVIGLSNAPIEINAIVMVVPKSVMPTERIGILFGQQQCINCLSYHSSPRRFLEAKGEDISEEMWGDIVIDGYVDGEDKLHTL